MSYENLDILVIIIIYNFHWMKISFGRYELFVWPKRLWQTWFLAESALADLVFGRIGRSPFTCQPVTSEASDLTKV